MEWKRNSLTGAILFIFTLVTVIGIQAQDSGARQAIHFVQLTDTHIGSPQWKSRLESAITRINALPVQVECVFVTGDIFMKGITDPDLVNAALDLFGQLKFPRLFTPGFYDISFESMEAFRTTSDIFRRLFGELVTTVEYGGVLFAAVYSTPLTVTTNFKGYQPLAELSKLLEAGSRMPVILLVHEPPVTHPYRGKHISWCTAAIQRLTEICTRFDVKAILAGLWHEDDLQWFGNVPVFVEDALNNPTTVNAAFRLYRYDHGTGRLSYVTMR